MAEKRRFLDVWIVEANTVYKEVPFDVVADWVEQGRLLESDMLRPSGTSEWQPVSELHELAVYVPKPLAEPEVPSAVEPMEPIEAGFTVRTRREAEDNEVDMIPLIDVSLVLLIFFMLTTRDVSGGGTGIPLPATKNGLAVNAPDEVWVGINYADNPDGSTAEVYSLGVAQLTKATNLKTQKEMLSQLQALLADRDQVDLTINANPDVPSGDVRELTVALEDPPFRSKILHKYIGVKDQTK